MKRIYNIHIWNTLGIHICMLIMIYPVILEKIFVSENISLHIYTQDVKCIHIYIIIPMIYDVYSECMYVYTTFCLYVYTYNTQPLYLLTYIYNTHALTFPWVFFCFPCPSDIYAFCSGPCSCSIQNVAHLLRCPIQKHWYIHTKGHKYYASILFLTMSTPTQINKQKNFFFLLMLPACCVLCSKTTRLTHI